jgi:hypothetical protein
LEAYRVENINFKWFKISALKNNCSEDGFTELLTEMSTRSRKKNVSGEKSAAST